MRDYTDADYDRADDRYHELVDEGRLPLRYGGRHLSALDTPLPTVPSAPPQPDMEDEQGRKPPTP